MEAGNSNTKWQEIMTLKNTGSCENTEEGADTIRREGRIVKNFFYHSCDLKEKRSFQGKSWE